MKNIGFIVGSLRKNSYSKRWANNIEKMLPEAYKAKFLEIGNLPLYNEDIDKDDSVRPESYKSFRKEASELEAFIFVTPEYNRTIPAALKNALDVGSRPYGESIWNNKPAMVVSHSISGLSGFGANHSIRQNLVCLNMPVMQQPELYLGNSSSMLDDSGNITSEDTKEFLQDAVNSFITYCEKLTN